MKKIALLFFLQLTLMNVFSQTNLPFAVEIAPNGFEAKFILKQDISTGNVIISVDTNGNIEISTLGESAIKYHWIETMVSGKIERIDDVKFEYYYDSNNPGKIKKIGNLLFTYYAYDEHESKVGKIKSIGNYTFNYYDFMAEKGKTGRISQIGNVKIGYFHGLENSGKVSQIGNIRISYNTDFDNNINSGKITDIIGNQEGVLIKTSFNN